MEYYEIFQYEEFNDIRVWYVISSNDGGHKVEVAKKRKEITNDYKNDSEYIEVVKSKFKSDDIDIVVFHELVHLIYPNHSKAFYNFLSIYMPDWRDRKTIL